jgi:ParB family chromosome partitioning protein
MERFGHTQEKLAEALGKSRSHIANLMRLLQLPSDVQDLLRAGQISAGHARALIVTDNPSELARQVAERGLSVRETERLAKGPAAQPSPPRPHKAIKDADTQALERDLSAALGMKVEIAHAGKGGSMTIRYEDLDQLDDLCRRLNRVIEPA